MAKEAEFEAPKMGMIKALLVVNMLGLGGLGYLQMTQKPQVVYADGGKPAAEEATFREFVEVGPVTANLANDARGSHLLYAKFGLRADSAHTASFLKDHMDELRSAILMNLSGVQADKLMTKEGKSDLINNMIADIGTSFEPMTDDPIMVGDIILKEFIIQ